MGTVRELFAYDGGRTVSVVVPTREPVGIVYAGDGALLAGWGESAEAAGAPPVLIVGAHRHRDEDARLLEYSPQFDPARFAAHEDFLVGDVRARVRERFGLDLPPERTAIAGVSASAELALALAMRHPDVYGVVLAASPGRLAPPDPVPALPRTYLVAGEGEPWFAQNARAWADALAGAGAEVVSVLRPGEHGGPFWAAEFPAMIAWGFTPR